jgi:hypothetical protein
LFGGSRGGGFGFSQTAITSVRLCVWWPLVVVTKAQAHLDAAHPRVARRGGKRVPGQLRTAFCVVIKVFITTTNWNLPGVQKRAGAFQLDGRGYFGPGFGEPVFFGNVGGVASLQPRRDVRG